MRFISEVNKDRAVQRKGRESRWGRASNEYNHWCLGPMTDPISRANYAPIMEPRQREKLTAVGHNTRYEPNSWKLTSQSKIAVAMQVEVAR